jgi:hypothetical protein
MAEAVEEFGAGVAVESRSEIGSALLATAEPEQVTRWRTGALKMRDALAWDNVAGEYEAIYREALQSYRR